MFKHFIITAVVLAMGSGAAHAATAFSANFTGSDGSTALDANLEAPPANYQILSNAVVNPGQDFDTVADRDYVRTVDSDYMTLTNFTAEILVTRAAGGGGFEGAYFGIGLGTPNPGHFGTPDQGFIIEMLPGFGPRTRVNRVQTVGGSAEEDLFLSDSGMLPDDMTSLVRLVKTGNSMVFEVDLDNNGSVDLTSAVIDLTDSNNDFLNGSNSHIFFGGGQNITFDNLEIVPEPASLALLGLGGLMMLRRRRN